jgi:hypothetical protein
MPEIKYYAVLVVCCSKVLQSLRCEALGIKHLEPVRSGEADGVHYTRILLSIRRLFSLRIRIIEQSGYGRGSTLDDAHATMQ